MSDNQKNEINIRDSLKAGVVDWIKQLIKIDIQYSDKPEGKYLFGVDIPIITGYLNVKITMGGSFELFSGHIKL